MKMRTLTTWALAPVLLGAACLFPTAAWPLPASPQCGAVDTDCPNGNFVPVGDWKFTYLNQPTGCCPAWVAFGTCDGYWGYHKCIADVNYVPDPSKYCHGSCTPDYFCL